jgi:hypothetical protein
VYGINIHYNGTRDGTVQWEGNQIQYKMMQMRMSELRRTIHSIINKSKKILINKLLMLRVRHGDVLLPIPWNTIRDNPAMLIMGYNFLEDARTTGWEVNGKT